MPRFGPKVSAYKVSMTQLAAFLVSDGRPVLDRTGLAGEFDFDNAEYAIDEGFLRLLASDRPMTAAPRPSLATALLGQLVSSCRMAGSESRCS